MTILTPPPLRPGACIGIVAPASPERHAGRVARGVAYLRSRGYRVTVGRHVAARAGYLAGSDAQRAADLNRMFADPRIDAIFCTRGGYGSARVLPLLDYAAARRNPKIFVGFSDLTAINLALLARAGIVSYNGALPGVDFWKRDPDRFTERAFWRAVEGEDGPGYPLARHLPREGRLAAGARGRLVGGNLSIVVSLIGTPYLPRLRGAIWVLEDVSEAPYRIDRMLQQCLLAGVFRGAAAIVFGRFARCTRTDRVTQSLDEVLDDFGRRVDVPMFRGLPFGHVARKLTLPIGARVRE